MNDKMINNLKTRLNLILNFVNGKTKEYNHHDIMNDVKQLITKVDELPCEFSLLLGDKNLINKAKNSYHPMLWSFIKDSNNSFEYFTGDHLHPVPNSVNFNKDTFNPTLAYYAMKKHGVLWTKKSGQVRIEYINHLMSSL